MYIVVGVMTTGVYLLTNLIGLKVIGGSGWRLIATMIVAHAFAIVFAYITNKTIVFQSETHGLKELLKQFGIFVAARLSAVGIDGVIRLVFIQWLGGFFIGLLGFNTINFEQGIWTTWFMQKLITSKDLTESEMLNSHLWIFVGQVFILVANYVFSKLIIFKKPKEDKAESKRKKYTL
jgi:putative flippase GtrA